MEAFALHQRLLADTAFVADWGLSRVLLMNDARYPWLILVPRRAGLSELHDLKQAERTVLIEEICRAGAGLKTLTAAPKINTGALGNQVPQLHVHVVARLPGDAAWPGSVWGQGTATPYEPSARDDFLTRLKGSL
jgi:diadenosine tetraphosphate (Ap4A) HIT family hydrolase